MCVFCFFYVPPSWDGFKGLATTRRLAICWGAPATQTHTVTACHFRPRTLGEALSLAVGSPGQDEALLRDRGTLFRPGCECRQPREPSVKKRKKHATCWLLFTVAIGIHWKGIYTYIYILHHILYIQSWFKLEPGLEPLYPWL